MRIAGSTSTITRRGTVDRSDLALTDAIRGALDDTRIRLPPRAEQRLIAGVAELLDAAGWQLTRRPAPFVRPTPGEIARHEP